MHLPAFFPQVRYISCVQGKTQPLSAVCLSAGVDVGGVGAWTNRPIIIKQSSEPAIEAEPGEWGAVAISTPQGLDSTQAARWALGALAYVLFDGVARASIAGQEWSRLERPRGRAPATKRALSNAQRQRRFRDKKGIGREIIFGI